MQLLSGLPDIRPLRLPALLQQGKCLLTLVQSVLPDLFQPVFPLLQGLLLLPYRCLRTDQATVQIVQRLLMLLKPALPAALQAFLLAQRGKNSAYDGFIAGIDLSRAREGTARLLVEQAALAAQAAILLAWESLLADAFCALRLKNRGMAYGAFDAQIDCSAIIARAMPQV